MGIAPHDVLQIQPDVFGDEQNLRPDWVAVALQRTPFVVVRRAVAPSGQIPVGVRGNNRQQRHAGMVTREQVLACVTPEMLAKAGKWRQHDNFSEALIACLEKMEQVFTAYPFTWGPTGSVGFELATGWPVVTPVSDLDCVIRADRPFPLNVAKDIYRELAATGAKFDIQLETPAGAVAFPEYLEGKEPFVLRTAEGPRLIRQRQTLWEEKTT